MTKTPSTVGMQWRKSSYSSAQGGNCVEVANGDCYTHLRDSKNLDLGYFSFDAGEWGVFLVSARQG